MRIVPTLLLLSASLITAHASDGAARRYQLFLGGWETTIGRQYETIMRQDVDGATVDPQSFWRLYGPEKIKTEVVSFLERLSQNESFSVLDPDLYEITITAIRFEGLPGHSARDPKERHVVVELSAWGRNQRTGIPLWFQLVMVPGRGIKTPTLVETEE